MYALRNVQSFSYFLPTNTSLSPYPSTTVVNHDVLDILRHLFQPEVDLPRPARAPRVR